MAAGIHTAKTAAPAAPAAAPALGGEPKLGDAVLDGAPLEMDFYRSMAEAAVDTHPMEDDDIADMCGALKYVHTEILTEHLQSPIRQTRKYSIDVITRHRMKIKNPRTILKTPNALQGEFGQFITYDFGKATNPAQLPMIQDQAGLKRLEKARPGQLRGRGTLHGPEMRRALSEPKALCLVLRWELVPQPALEQASGLT